jgi:hypothetical protein
MTAAGDRLLHKTKNEAGARQAHTDPAAKAEGPTVECGRTITGP